MQPVAAADDDWSVDTSEEAVQLRMGNLTSGVKGLALTDDAEKPQEERFNLFYSFVKVLNLLSRIIFETSCIRISLVASIGKNFKSNGDQLNSNNALICF